MRLKRIFPALGSGMSAGVRMPLQPRPPGLPNRRSLGTYWNSSMKSQGSRYWILSGKSFRHFSDGIIISIPIGTPGRKGWSTSVTTGRPGRIIPRFGILSGPDLDSPEYELNRRDTQHVDASNRPSNREYQHYIHLVELFKSWNYDDVQIAGKSPFLIQDPLFNALLMRSNEGLIRMGQLLGRAAEVDQLQRWQALSKKHFHQKLYCPDQKGYIYYDLRGNRPLKALSSSSFVPLSGRDSTDRDSW